MLLTPLTNSNTAQSQHRSCPGEIIILIFGRGRIENLLKGRRESVVRNKRAVVVVVVRYFVCIELLFLRNAELDCVLTSNE